MSSSSESQIPQSRASSPALDPVSRTSEILFGLIMVLSFTCSLRAADFGRDDVREMLIGALGCNLAWGIIDAFFYLMNVAAERGRERVLLRKLAAEPNQEAARKLFQGAVPEFIESSLSAAGFNDLRQSLLKKQGATAGALLTFEDLRASLLIFALVFLTTFPVALPFLLISEPERALRASNLVALLLLFSLGYSLGSYAGRRPLMWGLAMTLIGAALVLVTIALGG
ncbi:MAG: hypothetical protein DCC75_11925 [Proteobacteria bacterium]|nr:MAG: hypothetical protein DCC75_11925 [Pseudomonadota bacterium]